LLLLLCCFESVLISPRYVFTIGPRFMYT